MDKIIEKNNKNYHGAIKLIEQLYHDGLIPQYIFLNILKEYKYKVDVTLFDVEKKDNRKE